MALPLLSDVKEYLNIPPATTTHDTRLGYYLTAATSMVVQQVGPIAATSYSEVHDGGGIFIMLRRPPVLSITTIVEYVGIQAYPLTSQPLGSTTDMYGFSLSSRSGKVTRRDGTGTPVPFRGGKESIAVTYIAGTMTVDPAIFLAVLEDIRGLYEGTQMGSLPSITGEPNADVWSAPMGTFPRLASILSGFTQVPGIA